ncbi:MAG: DUF3226 domain-containing protein [Rikenellaceae bacterium]
MEDKKSLLLVEGKSEMYVIGELCPICGITKNFEIEAENSINTLKIALKTYLKSTNQFNKIWVIIDADTNFASAWQSIRDILIRSGKFPDVNHKTILPNTGIVIKPKDCNDITVGVWIMPNNSDVGMLEDFLMSLINDNNNLYKEAQDIIEKLELDKNIYPGIYKPVHKSKATIHTWLAWQDEPGQSLGTAINKRLFNTDKDLCARFTNWLNQL